MKDEIELTEVFCKIREVETMKTFFEEIFTPSEIKDFTLRWKLMAMLKKGVPQRKIASELGISLCKITRGSKIVKNDDSVTNRFLSQRYGGKR